MSEINTLKVQCAKTKADLAKISSEIERLSTVKSQLSGNYRRKEHRLIETAKAAFDRKQQKRKAVVEQEGTALLSELRSLLESFPELRAKEFAGKYEIISIENALKDLLPPDVLSNFIPLTTATLQEESDAYALYTFIENKVSSYRANADAGKLFDLITTLLVKVADSSQKGLLIDAGVVAVTLGAFIFLPLLFLTAFAFLGVSSLMQGLRVRKVLKGLYEVKEFLNTEYDEDLFSDEMARIIEVSENYVREAQEEFIAEIEQNTFVMDEKAIKALQQEQQREAEQLSKQLAILEARQAELQKALEGLGSALEQSLEKMSLEAKSAYSDRMGKLVWNKEWMDTVLLDITEDNRIITCKWTKGNTLYFSKEISQLHQFQQLSAYQSLLWMHPIYASQICFDYQYAGGRLIPLSRLNPNVIELCTTSDAISARLSRLSQDVYARFNKILTYCDGIEKYNQIMREYDAPPDSYCLIHVMGLPSLNEDWKFLLRNGERVGFFFKIYFTIAELKDRSKDFPFDLFGEFVEIGVHSTERTREQVLRLVQENT